MSSAASNVTRLLNRDTALKALYEDVAAKHMFPYWATTKAVANDEDRQLLAAPKAVPFLWRCAEDIEPILDRAVELVTMDDSERRSLVLMNPGLAPRRATVTTMYTAYRLNDANEIMPPHRHSPNAIRLGLKGAGNFTGVDGENIVFGPGDIVLTPNDTWHNHGTVGDETALNLSVLDLPLVESLNAVHFEHDYKEMEDGNLVSKKQQSERFSPDYSQRIYGYGGLLPRFASKQARGAGTSSPMFMYRYDQVRELLYRHRENDGDAHDGLMVEYIDPTSGQPVFKTITFFMQMIHPGQRTLPVKTTSSLLVSPFEGTGYSLVDGQKFEWNKFDTLAVPANGWFEHVNTGKDPLILFVASDEPTLKKLSLYRKWGKSASGEITQIFD